MGRGRMEETNLGFWFLAAHHQGNCVAVATSKPASPKYLIGYRYLHTSQTLPYWGLRPSGNGLGGRRELLPP